MGEPIPPSPEYGNDCPCCTDILWEPGKTPKHLYAFISGIKVCETGDILSEARFKLTQQDNPCLWKYFSNGWALVEFRLSPEPAFGEFFYGTPEKTYFHNDELPLCTLQGDNLLRCEWGDTHEDGSFGLTEAPVITTIAYTYGLTPIPYVLYHYLGTAPDSHVFRLCHPNGQTNIKIKFDDNLYAIAGP